MKGGELSVLDGVIFHGNRILVPKDLWSEAKQILHQAHQDLRRVRAMCETTCNLNAKSNSNLPPRPIQDPEYPFQMISLDYFCYTV